MKLPLSGPKPHGHGECGRCGVWAGLTLQLLRLLPRQSRKGGRSGRQASLPRGGTGWREGWFQGTCSGLSSLPFSADCHFHGGPSRSHSHDSPYVGRAWPRSDGAGLALSPSLLLGTTPPALSPEHVDFCRMRKQPSQVTRLVSNYHSDVLQPPSQELGAAQGEAGAPGSGASCGEDGMHLWVLWERGQG